MNKNRDTMASDEAAGLRREAEVRLAQDRPEPAPTGASAPGVVETQRLNHELQVHQIELELQNQELMQTRRQLEQSLEDYTDLYDFAPVAYTTLRSDGAIAKINIAGAELLGQPRATLIDQRFARYVAPDSRALFNAFFDRALNGVGTQTCELVITGTDAPPRYVHAEGIGLKPADVLLCRMVLFDVTQATLDHRALQESEARFRVMFEQAPLGVALIDARTRRFSSVNQGFADIAGRTRDQLTAGDWVQIIHPDDVRDTLSGLDRLNAGALRRVQTQARYLLPNGSNVWVDMTIALLTFAVGEAPGYLCMIEDITGRMQAEAALRETMERLKLAVEAADIGVFSWDLASGALDWDGRLCDWYQVPEAIRKAGLYYDFWRSRVHPDDLAWAEEQVSQVQRQGTPGGGDFRIVLPDGSLRYIHWAAVVAHDARGRASRMIGINLDLTAQRALDERLRAAKEAAEAANAELTLHRDHLQDLVLARTRELAASRDQAESANRAKSAFLATIGHELKTPMNHIMGTGYLLAKDIPGERGQQRLATIQHAAGQLLGLINDILEFSKSQADQIQIESIDFKPAALIDSAASGIRQSATAAGLALVCEVDPALPASLRGDPLRLQQVLERLLGNAVKFSSRGCIALRIKQIEAIDHQRLVRFEVEDQGIGITPEVQAGLFQLFKQGDSSSTRRFGGAGLGLALCRRLVTLMGGEIGVVSTPEQGSTFWFSLRLPVGEAPCGWLRDGAEIGYTA